MSNSSQPPQGSSLENTSKLGITQWLVLAVAAIGFLFDTYELLMTPLVLAPALSELLGVPPNHPDVTSWVGRVLWMTALCGGFFGLLGGMLIDRFGRKTVMVASIFIYSFSPVLAGLSTSLEWLIFFRCTTFVGVCVEFVAAVTWLAELFPDKRTRELAIGWTQAFASVGGVLVTAVSALITSLANDGRLTYLPETIGNAPWRYTLMTGLLPAIPIALLLPFVPESQVWKQRKLAGTLGRPSFKELFSPALARTTIVATLLSACAYAAAFGTLQATVTQGVPCLPVERLDEPRKEMGKLTKANAVITKELADLEKDSDKSKDLNKTLLGNLKAMGKINKEKIQPERERVQFQQELGGLGGRILLALALGYIVSRRRILQLFQLPGLITIPLVWFWVYFQQPEYFAWGVFLAGVFTVAQFSYFGEYLPKVFPMHLRGTGGSFATNIGGRMFGTSAALLTTNILAPNLGLLSPNLAALNTFEKVTIAAGIVGTVVFAIGLLLSFFLPEPPREESHS